MLFSLDDPFAIQVVINLATKSHQLLHPGLFSRRSQLAEKKFFVKLCARPRGGLPAVPSGRQVRWPGFFAKLCEQLIRMPLPHHLIPTFFLKVTKNKKGATHIAPSF
jgi:hypothetical protein